MANCNGSLNFPPEYLDKKHLLCPADATNGKPGVLTDGAADPTLPCSYLYQLRPEQKAGQEFLLEIEGDMLPIVRCEHHLLNLSVSGKIYRKGPQRRIYNNTSSEIHFHPNEFLVRSARRSQKADRRAASQRR